MEEVTQGTIRDETKLKKWYQDVTLEEAERYIMADMKSAAKSVIAIGYYLKCIRDGKLYLDAGYESIWDYAQDKYGFSKSTASRYMARNDKFSVDGNSPILAEEYREYSKAQLQEMLTLNDDQLDQVTPDMTIKEIREMRRPPAKEIPYFEIPGQISFAASEFLDTSGDREEAEETKPRIGNNTYMVNPEDFFSEPGAEVNKTGDFPVVAIPQREEVQAPAGISAYGTPKCVYPPDSLIATPGCEGGHDCFSCAMECRIREEDRYCREAPMGNPFPCEIMFGLKSIQDDIGDRCQFINHDLAFHRIGDGEPSPCCKECKEPCEYICGRAMKARAAAEAQQEQEPGEADKRQQEEDCCEKAAGTKNGDEKPETEEETLKEPLTDLQLLRDILDRQKSLLRKFLQTGVDENDDRIRKQKLLVGAIASMVTDLEEVQGEEEPDQPELPKLKNNDQRKEWLRNYRDWGIWYIDENIGCRYYKYDFDNGARLIAEEYDEHNPYCGDYVSSFLHLVGGPEPPKNPKYGFEKWSWHKTYSHHPDNETELIEFLKEVQKK